MNHEFDITVVASGGAPELAGGAELVALVDAIGTNWRSEPRNERAAMEAVLGEAATERAIGVAATFQMMNRLLDGVGAPVAAALHPVAIELGFEVDRLPR